MKSIIFTLAALGIVTMVTADCDSMKCIRPLSTVDLSDPENTCPYLRTAVGCLQTVHDTCTYLNDGDKAVIKVTLDESKTKIDNSCKRKGSGSGGSQNVCLVAILTIFIPIFASF